MGTVQTIKRVALSPEREALAAVVSEVAKARDHVAKLTEQVAHVEQTLADAKTRLTKASADVLKAKDDHAALVASAAATGASPRSFRSLKDARDQEREALDDVEAAEAALASLRANLEGAQYVLDRQEPRVREAANAVIAAEAVGPLFEEAKALQQRLIHLRVQLLTLRRDVGLESPEMEPVQRFLWDTEMPGSMIFHKDWKDHPAAKLWPQTRETLMGDPQAPLPA